MRRSTVDEERRAESIKKRLELDVRNAAMLEMWNAGSPGSKIASHFHVTTNVVVGVMARFREKGHDVRTQPKKGCSSPKKRNTPQPVNKPPKLRGAPFINPNLKPPLEPIELPRFPFDGQGKTVLDLDHYSCRFIIGRRGGDGFCEGEYIYCSGTVDETGPRYCKEHRLRMFDKRKPPPSPLKFGDRKVSGRPRDNRAMFND